MSASAKSYAIIAGAVLVCVIIYFTTASKLSAQDKLTVRQEDMLRDVRGIGELIYQHQEIQKIVDRELDGDKPKELSMTSVLSLVNKHNLKSPSSSKEALVPKPTYLEKSLNLKFKDEPLKNLVLFMLDAEELGNVIVNKIDVSRNPKDKDLWTSTLTIVQRQKKEDS